MFFGMHRNLLSLTFAHSTKIYLLMQGVWLYFQQIFLKLFSHVANLKMTLKDILTNIKKGRINIPVPMETWAL